MKSYLILLGKEIRDIFLGKTAILFLLLSSFILGNSFFTAVDLYSKASKAAVGNPVYAAGFEPVPGVFNPTFGALFVLFSLFLPFVIIPVMSNERKNNTISVLIQLPVGFRTIFFTKLVASVILVVVSLSMTLPSFILWMSFGGHIPVKEVILLISGYFLYGVVIVSISLASASLFKNVASAAILSILLIVISWVVDFAGSMNISPLILKISGYTLTKLLKNFESGILSYKAVFYFFMVSILFFTVSYFNIRFDLPRKWRYYVLTFFIIVILVASVSKLGILMDRKIDITESRRNSFPEYISRNLKGIKNLEIDVYLRETDSRFIDYKQNFLKKLELVNNRVKVKMIKGRDLEQNYGMFIYRVNGKSAKTYSNSEEEIIPLIFQLAGIKPVEKEQRKEPVYSGYPLVVGSGELRAIRVVYYLVAPLILIVFYLLFSYDIRLWRFIG